MTFHHCHFLYRPPWKNCTKYGDSYDNTCSHYAMLNLPSGAVHKTRLQNVRNVAVKMAIPLSFFTYRLFMCHAKNEPEDESFRSF